MSWTEDEVLANLRRQAAVIASEVAGRPQHPEAFCLMQYEADDGSETEVIWNSRDGVTPFCVTLKSGKSATHARWSEDVRVSRTMADALGVRRFVDMDNDTALQLARQRVDDWWSHPEYPMSGRWASKDEAARDLAVSYVGDGHAPHLADAPEAVRS